MNCEQCGNEVVTSFCPSCGRATPINPGGELLRHCEIALGQLRKSLASSEAYAKTGESADNEQTNRVLARLSKKRYLVAKWQRWVDYIKSTLQSQ